MQDSKLGSLRHQMASRLNAHSQTDWAIEDQAKTWTQQPVPMMSKHSAHWTSLPIRFRTWLWWYTCLLLSILMLWHRQAISEPKGNKLSSAAECIRSWDVSDTKSPAEWMPTHKTSELSRIKQKLESELEICFMKLLLARRRWVEHIPIAPSFFLPVITFHNFTWM